jgi:hypothetical protein
VALPFHTTPTYSSKSFSIGWWLGAGITVKMQRKRDAQLIRLVKRWISCAIQITEESRIIFFLKKKIPIYQG